MAKKNKTDQNHESTEDLGYADAQTLADLGIDLGQYHLVSAERRWVRPHQGLAVAGCLLGVRTVEDDAGKRDEAALKLSAPCQWMDDDGEQTAAVGDIVLVTLGAGTSIVADVKVGADVVILWGTKVPISKGRTVWNARVLVRPGKAPAPVLDMSPGAGRMLALASGETPANGGDDIPF